MCTEGPRCGDGVVQSMHEQCDDVDNDGGYGECAAGCRFGPRCGDGTVNGPEQCDDGNHQSGDGCSAACLHERVAGAR
jgi:cysteine-rich repeat protein